MTFRFSTYPAAREFIQHVERVYGLRAYITKPLISVRVHGVTASEAVALEHTYTRKEPLK